MLFPKIGWGGTLTEKSTNATLMFCRRTEDSFASGGETSIFELFICKWCHLQVVHKRKFYDFLQTLRWQQIPEHISDFDDFWTELIVMT